MVEVSQNKYDPRILVFGVGGAGCNATDNMIKRRIEGVDFISSNTDKQALDKCKSKIKIALGPKVTEGLGAGSKPDRGAEAASESIDDIKDLLAGAKLCFITAGMGGGTGTGAAPIIAKVAKSMGILCVGVVTTPFDYEGSHRKKLAQEGIVRLEQFVDTLIVVSNQKLLKVSDEKTTLKKAFEKADEVLLSGVKTISDLVIKTGMVNLDFADIQTVLSNMGRAVMGLGSGKGPNRAIDAASEAISNPLLDGLSLKSARGALINITASSDLSLMEVERAVERVRGELSDEANIIFGTVIDETLKDNLNISLVITGMTRPAVSQDALKKIGSDLPNTKFSLPVKSQDNESRDSYQSSNSISQERKLLYGEKHESNKSQSASDGENIPTAHSSSSEFKSINVGDSVSNAHYKKKPSDNSEGLFGRFIKKLGF